MTEDENTMWEALQYNILITPDSKHWLSDGKLHRENGPAIEYADGDKYWYLNGKLHRENGPAIEYPDGTKYWYLNGQQYTEQQFNELQGVK